MVLKKYLSLLARGGSRTGCLLALRPPNHHHNCKQAATKWSMYHGRFLASQASAQPATVKVAQPVTAKPSDKKQQPTEPSAANTEIEGVMERSIINPLEHHDFFGVRNLATIKELFDAKVHIGHKRGVRNPFMGPYVFGTRLNVDIIDLDQTLSLLGDALNFTAHVAYNGGVILFLSRNLQMMPVVEKTAQDSGEYAHCRYWKGGTFTNSTTQYGSMIRLPDLCIFISTHTDIFEQHAAIVESTKMNIPTSGILDTSCDPRLISYPVPGNDDTPSSGQLICNLYKEAILKGKAKRKEMEGLHKEEVASSEGASQEEATKKLLI